MDWGALERAQKMMVGTYDCSAFRGPGCEERNPLRTIREAIHLDQGAGEHWLEFEGPGFLRYQIRIMVGTLLEIGEGRRAEDDIPRIIASKDRNEAGKTALPDGLYLVEVYY
jgi:tRNA pseudouridine38-40 synthase